MSQILEDFSTYLENSERSSLTVKNYMADLFHFEKWFLETNGYANFALSEVTPTDLREFKQLLLINKEMKPASVNRRLASLRSLLKWANEVGISPDFQLSKIPKFEKTEKTGIRWLDRKEENALLRSVERSGAKRDIAIIKLVLNTGLRVAELCSLRWSEIIINERKGVLTVLQGKGGKRREVPLNYDARQVLLDLGYKQNAGKKEWIFVGQRGKLTPRGVQTLFRKYADSVKLKNLSPHSLRHTFCKNLLNAGISLEKIAILAGHESLDTTRLYLEPSLKDLEGAVEAISEER
ncbi:MAG: tyrosine-type recombinase/integrase [Pyrinomonadaceae bacterium]|nr:tyrosine-type recombinase/integrase [Pyrinomonadaceae bacterium]